MDIIVSFFAGVIVGMVVLGLFLPSKIIYNASPNLSAIQCVDGEPVIDMY